MKAELRSVSVLIAMPCTLTGRHVGHDGVAADSGWVEALKMCA